MEDYPKQRPLLGLALPCRYRYVREADQIQVGVGKREFCVMLLNCWAPPRGDSHPNNPESFAAREAAQQLCEQAKRLVLWIPAPPRVDDLMVLGENVAGYLFLDDGQTLNEVLVRGAHCRSAA